jgi:pectinesterase
MLKIKLTIFLMCCTLLSISQKKIIVDQKGKGDFKTIQGAINSLADSSNLPRTIFIKNGIYKEKIYIEKNNIVFEGENIDKTIITCAIARDEYRCGHMDDWGVATMNVGANDITLKNFTLINSYGLDNKIEKIITCSLDTITHQKKISASGHQMALRTLNATKLKAINCHFIAYGGDTVSPWEVENGLWYFKDCIMEGGVDFYCPRGWAWAEGCTFIAKTGPASIWHDGSKNPDSKSILINCIFKGFDGFLLGRYHRDAQMYLINCNFDDNMKDSTIYLVKTANEIKWGRRIYFYNCNRKAGNYDWFKNNINKIEADKISINWLFGNKWNLKN